MISPKIETEVFYIKNLLELAQDELDNLITNDENVITYRDRVIACVDTALNKAEYLQDFIDGGVSWEKK